jgi:hypothetical protein
VRTAESISAIDAETRRRIVTVILDNISSGPDQGLTGIGVYNALRGRSRWIGLELSVAQTLEILDALRDRGRIVKHEGETLTLWRTK